MATAAEMQYIDDARDGGEADGRGPLDRFYFLHVWTLMVAGIVFVFSASFPVAGRPDALMLPGNPYHYLAQHAQFVGMGLVAMLVTSLIPPRLIRGIALWAFGICTMLMGLALFSPWGVTLGGAPRWLDIPGLPVFQPAELMKLALILVLAHFMAKKDEDDAESMTALGWAGLIAAGATVFALMQRDQGMATMYAAITFALLFFAGVSRWKLAAIAVTLTSGGLLAAYQVPYRWRRIMAFLFLDEAPADDRYHILNMLIAQARGGIWGMGLGMSPDKWHSLPAPHTDSIFSVIGCETGLVGGMVLLVAIALLTWRGLRIAERSQSSFGFYVAAGVSAMLCIQSLAHVAVNTACMPVTGLTLPFISGGGTSLMSASVAAGIVLAVSRYRKSGEA